jgi:hypothetical protein
MALEDERGHAVVAEEHRGREPDQAATDDQNRNVFAAHLCLQLGCNGNPGTTRALHAAAATSRSARSDAVRVVEKELPHAGRRHLVRDGWTPAAPRRATIASWSPASNARWSTGPVTVGAPSGRAPPRTPRARRRARTPPPGGTASSRETRAAADPRARSEHVAVRTPSWPRGRPSARGRVRARGAASGVDGPRPVPA